MIGFGDLVGGTGAPGFAGSSAAQSSAGPISVGGLTFAPPDDDKLTVGLAMVAVVLVAVFALKR